MSSKIYDLEDLIDIREYVGRMEAEQRKKAELLLHRFLQQE